MVTPEGGALQGDVFRLRRAGGPGPAARIKHLTLSAQTARKLRLWGVSTSVPLSALGDLFALRTVYNEPYSHVTQAAAIQVPPPSPVCV